MQVFFLINDFFKITYTFDTFVYVLDRCIFQTIKTLFYVGFFR